MAQNANLQERYSALVEAKLRAESVFIGLMNRRFEGSPKAGAVKIPYRSEATVGEYNIVNGGTLAHPTTSYRTLVCDKDFYVDELIDGFEAAGVPDGLIADRLDSAGFALADKIDVNLGAMLKAKGTALDSTTALTYATVYISIVDAIQTAKKLKVRPSDIWVVVDNATYGLLLKSEEFMKATTGDLEKWGAGFVGRIDGAPVFESCNMPEGVEFIVGNYTYPCFVAEWQKNVGVEDLKDGIHIGCSAVQGRLVCGYDLFQTSTVLVKTVSGE